MDSCAKTRNRTAPTGGEDGGRRSGGSRTNGWSWPPHPFQMLAWLLYAYFAAVGLGVLVPLLPAHWTPAGYICTGVMFACHLCTHVMAVSVDPADRNVRAKSPGGPLPVFERSKRAHVIENCHCYLCQVDVGPKSKHCSACNKCVANFDHHCRWLNNCVGSRNYKLFLYSVASAALGACVLLAVSSYVLIAFFSEPAVDRSRAPNRTAAPFPFSPPAAAVPALAAVTGGLALLACVLLCHLLLFHFYLMWNRLSTYEYIVRQRHRQDGRRTTSREDVERATRPSVRLKVTRVRSPRRLSLLMMMMMMMMMWLSGSRRLNDAGLHRAGAQRRPRAVGGQWQREGRGQPASQAPSPNHNLHTAQLCRVVHRENGGNDGDDEEEEEKTDEQGGRRHGVRQRSGRRPFVGAARRPASGPHGALPPPPAALSRAGRRPARRLPLRLGRVPGGGSRGAGQTGLAGPAADRPRLFAVASVSGAGGGEPAEGRTPGAPRRSCSPLPLPADGGGELPCGATDALAGSHVRSQVCQSSSAPRTGRRPVSALIFRPASR
ncbi:palmitoyltransferase ZDHHC1 isoform X2 [Hippocampus zosterae]|uniref:palmitoyltransferase ZDHHC1 isoform X2 n=1 Tax=Hippocampus zosterae TaxID=109293 RepID=UPI00223DF998|nr:palmitoyltransferase ZDHHC1 isoform X2 [Hippocampus zosterae]